MQMTAYTVLMKVPARKPENFWEAIQSVWTIESLLPVEENQTGMSIGRVDQYMYPYYKHDLENGIATREFMQELIENFYIKIWDLNKLRNHILIRTFGNGGIGGPAPVQQVVMNK